MSFETSTRPGFGLVNLGGVVGGSLFGAVVGGIGMQLLAADLLADLGALLGSGTVASGWVLLLALGLSLGVAFVAVLSRTVDAFVDRIIALTSRSPRLKNLLLPLLSRSALGVTAAGLGVCYGLAVGVGHVLVVPTLLTYGLGHSVPLGYGPATATVVAVVSWAAYGSTLGFVYGLATEA